MAANAGTDPTRPPVADSVVNVREYVRRARQAGRKISIVPTMGALHAGHLSLIEAARRDNAFTIVTIYVNPTQFAPGEDLDAYPRTFDADRAACRDAGVDLIFAPTDAVMYPAGDQTRVHAGPLADTLCGRHRPGHFDGVCTVVAKLFGIVQPDVAVFGQKDAQQALIIRRMTRDLFLPIEIVVCPIVREPDGLALSSRNAYLSPPERKQALCLSRALNAGRTSLLAGEARDTIVARMHDVVAAELGENSAKEATDYLVAVDAETLEPATDASPAVLLAGAVRIGRTRLIDNLLVDRSASGV
ncbi:MAG: pantoate--beta-alanine ligase [Phycisphaerales bacterium]|nr:pantoate--beta-alanine ligase [Phycisphaerales bacterium]MCB9856850.1 pantoate--beta-alanine ligase [Phycisphaerales bacterium]MCB9862023.1 pantoate--beta-alanine ligase [Phycisphaerales bacterium]